ncbi:protein of unknown function [Paenibacillus alvei]|uniref:Uncharacterized protein n=1 Tax=Paenibacillus alvei TaxID=44250 RepID=A0A383R7R0_PAEAL|nr:protein of unknown function [Paenibacillus alvei]
MNDAELSQIIAEVPDGIRQNSRSTCRLKRANLMNPCIPDSDLTG